MASALPGETKGRLLAAAAELFAARGFRGATMREIAARAGVNLASSHYHYGSKQDLYFEVLRAQFAAVSAEFERHGAKPAEGFERLTREQLIAMLHNRTRVMLAILLGPRPGLHGALMQREMCDPSAALPVIVNEFLRPMMADLHQILKRLAPSLDPRAIERSAYSLVGQLLFYQFGRPAVLMMMDQDQYAPDFIAISTEQIVEFSVGGLDRLEANAAAIKGGRKRVR